MSRQAIFPLIGAYNKDNTIFEGLTLPTGHWLEGYDDLFGEEPVLDKEVLINNLLIECGQMSLMHSNTEFLKFEIEQWSAKNIYTWTRLFETIYYKYNPIWNKDGKITRTETHENGQEEAEETSGSGTRTGSWTSQASGTEDRQIDSSGSDKHSVNGYNDTTNFTDMKPRDMTDSEDSQTVDASTSNTGSGTSTENDTSAGSKSRTISGTGSDTYEALEQGNIGVTMTQEMIERQRRVISLNMYDFIIESFKHRFLLLIY